MSQRKASKTKSESGRKKLTLRKETLKDLTANVGRANRVRGGVVTRKAGEEQNWTGGCA